jgi:hypothetical protein
LIPLCASCHQRRHRAEETQEVAHAPR